MKGALLAIHPIWVRNGCWYYYWANANLIIRADYAGSCAIQNYDCFNKKTQGLDNRINGLKQAYGEMVYLYEKYKRLSRGSPQSEDLRDSTMIDGIRIIPTSNCNMDCRYCPQKRNKLTMDINLALKVIKFIESRSLCPRVHIKFYGGEPFMNFSVIEYMVEKLSSWSKESHHFLFSATTNGTIMNKRILNFLIRHNFNLAISLDGPPHLHNKNRIFRNGQGSFNVIFKNIQKIREENETYFRNHVSIQPTLNPKSYSDYKMAMDFFLTNGLQNISINWLIQEKSLINKNIVDDIIFRIIKRNYESFPFIDLLKYLDILRMDKGGIKMHTCRAGIRRLAISPLGELYPCEQLIHNDYYKIGNILTGLDVEILNKIWASAYDGFERCAKCWAVRFCPYYCLALQPFSNKRLCDRYKKRCEQLMRIYIALVEHSKNCYLDFLSHIHSRVMMDGEDVFL